MDPSNSPLTQEEKFGLYKSMLRIRMVEERIADLYTEQEMKCPCHLCIGQEAVPAAVCANLREDDHLFGTYRGHGIYLAKGGDLKAMLAELYGRSTGSTKGRGGSMQLIAPEVGLLCTSAIVGGTIPMGVGSALATVMQKSDRVAVVNFGEGATEEGVFHESLNFAALKKLPVLFVCEHNYFATYSHQDARQNIDNVFERAAIYGMPGSRVDGNDVSEVFTAVRSMVERARNGGGPSLIECRTYRWLEHVGPYSDIDLGYREEKELNAWKARCPVTTFREKLVSENILDDDLGNQLKSEIGHEIEEAVHFAQNSPFPDASELADGVYYERKGA